MIETILGWLGFGLCHQLPERSLFGGGLQAPVCARDMGIYIGFVFGLTVLVLLDRRRRSSEPPPLGSTLVLVFLIGLMALDGLTSYMGLRETTNQLRLFTGLCAGFGIAGLTLPMLNGQLWRVYGRERILGDFKSVIVYLIAIPVVYAFSFWVLPELGIVLALFTAASILFTFTAVNLVIVCLLPPFERQADALRDAWIPIVLAFSICLLELGVASWIRVQLLALAGVS